jgi:hypothetical protein
MKCNVDGIDCVKRIAMGLVLVRLVSIKVIDVWDLIGVIPLNIGSFKFRSP